MLIPFAQKIIEKRKCGFGCKRSANDHTFCICQIHEENWEYNGAVHRLFIDFKTTYDPVKEKVLYNILTETGIPIIRVRY